MSIASDFDRARGRFARVSLYAHAHAMLLRDLAAIILASWVLAIPASLLLLAASPTITDPIGFAYVTALQVSMITATASFAVWLVMRRSSERLNRAIATSVVATAFLTAALFQGLG